MPDLAERLAPALEGRYQLERKLGAGGMASVYLADDLRHGRKVAIKVLHPELSELLGPERFLAEIKTTAKLQHPHILPLFDSGAADGLLFYVMPYAEGETLRWRLTREHQLPVADAVQIACEVADALEYAHGHGLVHRDIKPENILLGYRSRDRNATAVGHALVADFGIALAVEQAGGSRLTQTGLSLGTPQYMAPEQAMGDRSVDHRADIYALGVVLYEMLTGEPPFTGPTAQAIVAKVITERPRPLSSVRETVPPHIASAVDAALQKLAADRPRTASEFAGRLTGESPHGLPTAPIATLRRRSASQAWAAGILVLALASLGSYLLGRRSGPARVLQPPSRLALLTPALASTGVAASHRQLALTPDGGAVIFVALGSDSLHHLAYQPLGAAEPMMIQGSARMMDPQISPDGRWLIAYGNVTDAGGTAERAFQLPLKGGTPTVLPPGADSRHGGWTADGSFWFTTRDNGRLRRLAANGQEVAEVRDRSGLRLQQILDGGPNALMLRLQVARASGSPLVYDLETGEERDLLDVPMIEARYTAGHLW